MVRIKVGEELKRQNRMVRSPFSKLLPFDCILARIKMGHQLMVHVIIGPFVCVLIFLQRAFYWLMSKTRHITEPCHRSRSGAAGSIITTSSLSFRFIATVLVTVQLLAVAPLMS